MATTLAEYAKLSLDVLLQGVIETILKDSPILQSMPFIEIVGNGLTYNREKAITAAKFYAVDGGWDAPPAVEFDPLTAVLKILGQDADVDNYVKATRQNVQDIEAVILELTAKNVRMKFEQTFIYGTVASYLTNQTVEANAFDGILKLIDTKNGNAQVIAMGITGGTLTLGKIDELIDAVKGGKPDLLLMSRRSRRKVNNLVRGTGSYMETAKNEYGEFIQLYNGIPIGVSDYILDTHTLASSLETNITGAANSTIYALAFGEGALCGITGPGGLTVEPIGVLEGKDATRTRIKWYTALADFATVKRAALIGVQD